MRKTVTLNITVPRDLAPRIQAAAAADHRSVSSWVSVVVARALSEGVRDVDRDDRS